MLFPPFRFLTLIFTNPRPQPHFLMSISILMIPSSTHNAVLARKSTYLSFKLVMDLHLYNLYSKVYKSFLPFQKWFSFCCSTECQWITICRPCYKVCVFCATFGFVLLSRREEKLSIKSDNSCCFVWRSWPLQLLFVYSKWSDANNTYRNATEDTLHSKNITIPELDLPEVMLWLCEKFMFFFKKSKQSDSYCAPRHH